MKQLIKAFISCTVCALLLITGSVPIFAATSNIKERKHQTPASSSIAQIYAIDQENQTYHQIPESDWKKINDALSIAVTPAQAENKNAKYVGGFCYELINGVRRIYTISTTQVLVGNTPLYATVSERTALEKLSKTMVSNNPAVPAMIAYMEPLKITRLTATSHKVKNPNIGIQFSIDLDVAAKQQAILEISNLLKGLKVESKSTTISNGKKIPSLTKGDTNLRIEFNTGTYYDILISKGLIWMGSSDGTRSYTYNRANYDPRQPMNQGDSALELSLWEHYLGDYMSAAIFRTKPGEMRERIKGAFYSNDDNGADTIARLGQILNNIRTKSKSGTIYASMRNYIEVYAQGVDGVERYEFDRDSLTAYYVKDGRGYSVPISESDYRYVESLLNGKDRSNRTFLIEDDSDVSSGVDAIYTCTTRDPLFGTLFDPKEKDDKYDPYTTGAVPAYTKYDSFNCWGDTGTLSCTTIYSNGVMVQNSQRKPWTPTKLDARKTFSEVKNLIW